MSIINENGITFKLVEFCNENKTFARNFIALFTDKKDFVSIVFTGNTTTGYGKPDITITFADNFIYYIEVKTKKHTNFQENQVSKKSGYEKLIKNNKQKTTESLGYLLDNNHDKSLCLTDNVVSWQTVFELVEDFNNQSLAKDIKQNVDGIILNEKLFGPDEEVFSNPYQLAIFNDTFLARDNYERVKNNWIFNTFLIPALQELNCSEVYIQPYNESNPHISYVSFKKDNNEYHIMYNGVNVWKNYCADNNLIGSYYLNSFTFYRPWILGVRTSINIQSLQKETKKSIQLWLYDLENNIQTGKCSNFEKGEEYEAIGYLGEKASLWGNPYVFANCIEFLRQGNEIYDDIVVPALHKIPEIKLKDISFDIDGYRYIVVSRNKIKITFNIFQVYTSKTKEWKDYFSFIFYRPWIVGVHKAKAKEELIEFTMQSIELWLIDLEEEELI